MTSALESFLATAELDQLLTARNALTPADVQGQAEVLETLANWQPQQAIANLLMYPELIPAQERYACVMRGLQEKNWTYLPLAAVVGLERQGLDAYSVAEQEAILQELLQLASRDQGILAERISNFVASHFLYCQTEHLPQIASWLDHDSDAVKHNSLATLIPLVGLENIRQFLDQQMDTGHLSAQGRHYAETRFSNIEGFSDDNQVQMGQLDLGNLSGPLLSYIPSLQDWLASPS